MLSARLRLLRSGYVSSVLFLFKILRVPQGVPEQDERRKKVDSVKVVSGQSRAKVRKVLKVHSKLPSTTQHQRSVRPQL